MCWYNSYKVQSTISNDLMSVISQWLQSYFLIKMELLATALLLPLLLNVWGFRWLLLHRFLQSWNGKTLFTNRNGGILWSEVHSSTLKNATASWDFKRQYVSNLAYQCSCSRKIILLSMYMVMSQLLCSWGTSSDRLVYDYIIRSKDTQY